MHIRNKVNIRPFVLNEQKWNSEINLWKMPGSNPNLRILNMNAYIKRGEIPSVCSKDIERNEILTSIKVHNSVTNFQKMPCNNLNLDLVNIDAYIKGGDSSVATSFGVDFQFFTACRQLKLTPASYSRIGRLMSEDSINTLRPKMWKCWLTTSSYPVIHPVLLLPRYINIFFCL